MKLTEYTYAHISCKTETERGDVIALLELLGYTQIHQLWEFDIAPYVFVYGTDRIYQLISSVNNIPDWEVSATDFIKDNF